MRKLTLARKRSLKGYLFILPFLIGFIILFVSPLLFYINMSFSDIKPGYGSIIVTPAGLEHYKEVFLDNQTFIKELFASVQELLFKFPTVLIFSFIIASILNQKFRGRVLARAIFFLPVVVASGIALVIASDLSVTSSIEYFSGSTGDKNFINIMQPIYKGFYVIFGGLRIADYITDIISQIYMIAISSGVQILIFLAALQTIPPSLYEASSIEGATAWENFWKITLPLISPMIVVNAVYTLIDTMSGPNNSMINTIYEGAMVDQKYCLSAAMGVLYFTISILVLAVIVFIINKFVFYENA